MRLLLLLGALVPFAVNAPGSRPAVHADVVYATAFLRGDHPPWTAIQWRKTPTQNDIDEVVPFSSGRYGMVGVSCAGLTATGGLARCTVSEEPEGVGYRRAGEALLGGFAVSDTFRRRWADRITFISLQIRLSNSDVEPTAGPCWPPNCILERWLLPPPRSPGASGATEVAPPPQN